LRLAHSRTDLARLEIRDAAFAAELDAQAESIDRTGGLERHMRLKVLALAIAAVISLVMVAIFVMPSISDRLALLVPARLESRLGQAVDARVRAMLERPHSGSAFECGASDSETAGHAALTKLVGTLERAAGLPLPLQFTAVRRSEANAIALPGGRIYVFQGLIAKAESPDELAGVIAHEIGHVAAHDGTKAVLRAGGMSFLFGMLLGDFVGGGAVVIAARAVLQSSYSREAETAADAYSVELMSRISADPKALATILGRIARDPKNTVQILRNHPGTRERITAIAATAPPAGGRALLKAGEWAALQRMCGG
jgi:Zn-dependent protease with chaperone function